jgi:hypothetical protein
LQTVADRFLAPAPRRQGTTTRLTSRSRRIERPLDKELARSPVWGVGQWNQARWGSAVSGPTIAQDLCRAIRTQESSERAVLLARLSREPLLVSPWVAVPAVRAQVAELGGTHAGRVVRRDIFPLLCQFALRLAWRDVAPEPGAAVTVVAARLHTRAMAYMVELLRSVADDPENFAALVTHGPLRDRSWLLLEALGGPWRARQAVMLDCTPEALRTRRWRRKRDARSKGRIPPDTGGFDRNR